MTFRLANFYSVLRKSLSQILVELLLWFATLGEWRIHEKWEKARFLTSGALTWTSFRVEVVLRVDFMFSRQIFTGCRIRKQIIWSLMQVFLNRLQIPPYSFVSQKHVDRCFLICKDRAVQHFGEVNEIDSWLQHCFHGIWLGHILNRLKGLHCQTCKLVCDFLRCRVLVVLVYRCKKLSIVTRRFISNEKGG